MNYQKKTLNRKMTGCNINKCICNSQYTFEDVAFLLDLTSTRVIYEWIKGSKIPSLENFYNFLCLFNISMEDILVFD